MSILYHTKAIGFKFRLPGQITATNGDRESGFLYDGRLQL